MKLLAIETSCDETAVAILECTGDEKDASFIVLGNALLSQISLHQQYGGVFPALAKREHAKNLVPIMQAALEEAELLKEDTQTISPEVQQELATLLEREPELHEQLMAFLAESEVPAIDAIAVTNGPGLEPALWVGVNFARALSKAWGVPLVPVSHMEGHILASLVSKENESLRIHHTELPLLALLISGGHTELVLMKEWLSYELIGQTRDDAVGEAYDKVARMMHLPYPGGPEVSKLAEKDREDERTNPFSLPRPMLDAQNCDFSFSGLKTAVMYLLKEKGELSELEKEQLARAFEDAVGEVLLKKTLRAIEETNAHTLAIGGGVSANTNVRRVFTDGVQHFVSLRIPSAELTGDNAIMIGLAGYYRFLKGETVDADDVRADGNLALAQ